MDEYIRDAYIRDGYVRVEYAALKDWCQTVFERLRLPATDAAISADVLLAADLRGIPSHGIARLRRYVNGLQSGIVAPNAPVEVVMDTPSSLVLDAQGAMGAPVSVRAMESLIAKASGNGSAVAAAFGCVRNSTHFGIAGYYAMLAMQHDMIGIAMTNTAALGVPTFGRRAMFGTNPIAFAAPADQEQGFVLDMATTVVTRGKVEVYERLGKELPAGWAVDKTGQSARDARSLLDDMGQQLGGGILPLGGLGEQFSGYKGYGLAVMVDILCAVLCGAPFGPAVVDAKTTSGRVSHFFGAMRIDAFRDPAEFRRDMDTLLGDLRRAQPAEGEHRVYFAGLKEFEQARENLRLGVPLLAKTYRQLQAIGAEFGVDAPPATVQK